jgi:hypothetical protein
MKRLLFRGLRGLRWTLNDGSGEITELVKRKFELSQVEWKKFERKTTYREDSGKTEGSCESG